MNVRQNKLLFLPLFLFANANAWSTPANCFLLIFCRYNKLREIQKALESPVALKQPHSVRWLSLDQAVQAVYKCWSALVGSLGEDAVNRNPTADGLAKKVETYPFLAHTAILCDILPIFTYLSKTFQASDLNIDKLTTALATTRTSLEGMIADRRGLPLYSNLYNLPTVDGCITYEGIQLKRSEDVMRRCDATKDLLVHDLLANLEHRFPEDGMSLLQQLFSILSPAVLRGVPQEGIVGHGLDALVAIADKFENVREPHFDFNRQRAQQDFLLFKNHARSSPAHFTFADFVVDLCSEHNEEYPDFALLAEYLMAIPLNSASCERGFSAQNLTKTKTRNRMTEERLDQLMRISINGPHMARFDYADAARNFRLIRKRRK